MKNPSNTFDSIYNSLSQWFDDFNRHEVTNVIDIVAQAKLYLEAAESIPEDNIKQFLANFRYDLHEFHQQYNAQLQHSVYLGLLNERFWMALTNITDKSQIEWAELNDDFKHSGEYHSGDSIGFGELECIACHQSTIIVYLSEVSNCMHCGGKSFTRKALAP